MGISDDYQRLSIEAIYVDRAARQRGKIEVEDLVQSIKRNGVINPLIVTREGQLIAGERRLEASKLAGLLDVPVRFLDELEESERQLIELEENLKRKDIEWDETARAIKAIHDLYRAKDPDWTHADTGAALGLTQSAITKYLGVAAELHQPKIANAGTLREALDKISRDKM